MILLPLPVVVTRHADGRWRERAGCDDLDELRVEVTAAIRAGRYEHRARNIWYVWTRGRGHVFPVAVTRGRLVVMTVLASDTAALAA